jgi:hypothetical protein
MIIQVKHIVQGNPGSSSGPSDTSLFTSVERLELNPCLALIFKCATLAAGGAATQITYCPEDCSRPSVWVDEILRGFFPFYLVG